MKATPDRRYALNVAFSGAPAFGEARDTWRRIGASTAGVETIYGGPLTGDANKQIEELEMLVEQNVSGIVVYPSDPAALAPTIDKAVAKGIPVVTLFSDVSNSKRLTCVQEPEVESGRKIATKVFEDFKARLQQPCGVLISYARPSMENQVNRRAGIEQVIKEWNAKNGADIIKIVDTVSDEIDDAKGAEAIRAAFTKHGKDKIQFIFGCDSRSAIAAVSVLKELKLPPKKVVVTGWDSDADVLDLIAAKPDRSDDSEWVHATVILYVSAMTQTAFGLLESYNLGYMYPESLRLREFSVPPVPSSILVPVNAVDKHNVGAYRK